MTVMVWLLHHHHRPWEAAFARAAFMMGINDARPISWPIRPTSTIGSPQMKHTGPRDVATDDGPVWPLTFTAAFSEILYNNNGTVLATNPGMWYYDFANRRARFDHLKGQATNFCSGQGLSDDEPDADCRLIFAPGTEMYVHYPSKGTCCQLCEKGIGCSPLLPDWIADGKPLGAEQVGGSECRGFVKRGAVADDYWFDTADDPHVPCRYYEVLDFGYVVFYHNLTFDQASYSTAPIPDSVFDVPDYCNKMCPHPFPYSPHSSTASLR